MFQYFQTKKENWILLIGGISLSLSIILYYIFQEPNSKVSRSFSQFSFGFFVIITLVVAPIIEEFAFRGFFSKKRIVQVIALVLTLILALSSATKTHMIVPIIIMLVSYFFLRISKNRKAFTAFVISNASLFSLYHYTLKDLLNLNTIYYPLFHFTIGLVLIWIVINFSLRKAMITHGLWNAINIFTLLMIVQTPSKQLNVYTNTNGTIKWQKVKRFLNNESSSINFNYKGLNSTKIEAIKLLKVLSDKESSEINLEVAQKNPYHVYDIEIELNEQPTSQKEVWFLCLNLLKESDLIKEFE